LVSREGKRFKRNGDKFHKKRDSVKFFKRRERFAELQKDPSFAEVEWLTLEPFEGTTSV